VVPRLQIDDDRIWYVRNGAQVGDRPALLLIHGAGGSHLLWPPQLRALPEQMVLALDLPGHGRSAGPGRDTVAGYATAVINLMDALDLEQAVLGGHSMGGAISLWAALEYPQRVAALVLMATGARLRVAPAIVDGLLTDLEGTLNLIASWSYGPAAPDGVRQLAVRAMQEANPPVTRGDFLACDQYDVRDRLAEIKVPTLVLSGSDDKMTPPKFAEYLVSQIPHAELRVFQNAGHMLTLEQPDQVAEAVQQFLSRF
jgi:pimeloyl-ACP methyl ester carboxylesterase